MSSLRPTNWKMVRLDEIADIIGGSTPSRNIKKYWNGDIPWVVPSELTRLSGRYLYSTNETITQDGLKSSGLKMIPPNSVLLTTRATIGEAAINRIAVATNQGFQNLIPKCGTDPVWLYYYILHIQQELARRASGSTFREVSRKDIRSLRILQPPFTEQKKIAKILESIDEVIERTEDVIIQTKQLQDSLLYELLAWGLPGHHTDWKEVPGIGNIPVDWQVVPLGQYALVGTGGTPSRSRTEYWHGSIPWMVSGDINQIRVSSVTNYITDEGLNNSNAKIFPAGTIMVAMNGQGTTRGKTAQLAIDTSCNQSLAAIQTNNNLHNNYLFYLLRFYYNKLRRLTGDGRTGLNLNIIRNILIPLPSLLEQQKIADMLYTVDIYLQNLRNILEIINAIKVSTSENIFSQIVSRKGIS